jgi:hypothetical protein
MVVDGDLRNRYISGFARNLTQDVLAVPPRCGGEILT